MGEIFKGWRRKTGCILLVMGCVFACGWIRSRDHVDGMIIIPNTHSIHYITSGAGGLSWQADQELLKDGYLLDTPNWISFRTETGFDDFTWNFFQTGTIKTRIEWGGFRFGRIRYDDRDYSLMDLSLWRIPYWSIVIPLTLLSAYLLLTKPRVTKPKQTEPTTAERA